MYARIKMVANHGQQVKYQHKMIGVNSRLDTLQAAILDAKLPHLDEFAERRRKVAERYDEAFGNDERWIIPYKAPYSTHVYHQYTLQVTGNHRDDLHQYLKSKGIPSMVYYPIPLHKQPAFYGISRNGSSLNVSEYLVTSVLSLPIHTEMSDDEIDYLIETVRKYGK